MMARSLRRPTPRPVLTPDFALVDILRPLEHPERVGEKQWEQIVEQMADVYGWQRMRVQKLRMKDRWITGTTARGWPDLTLVRPPWVVFLELKGGIPGQSHIDPDQKRWIRLFQRCGGNVRAFVVRPQDARHVVALLADPASLDPTPEPTLGSDHDDTATD